MSFPVVQANVNCKLAAFLVHSFVGSCHVVDFVLEQERSVRAEDPNLGHQNFLPRKLYLTRLLAC